MHERLMKLKISSQKYQDVCERKEKKKIYKNGKEGKEGGGRGEVGGGRGGEGGGREGKKWRPKITFVT